MKDYYVEWDADLHITRFIKHLNDGQKSMERDKKSKIRDELVRWWYVRKGFHREMRENFMGALDETYYEQLEHDVTGYQGVNTQDFFTHLKSVWCSLDTGAIEDMKKDYYVEWDADLHITRFIKHLNDGQKRWRETASRYQMPTSSNTSLSNATPPAFSMRKK